MISWNFNSFFGGGVFGVEVEGEWSGRG